ncbi:hypothetical protein J3B02_001078 [Coemansia erecta]|uniref:Uncharacterized protein n=1 Tax=Coemansia asiatica TaxID=1052880 RepID=A0A9W7XJE4_9FUNG|nr:hypothetical protein LPJ64_004255 [Coemansia asiatica]KAJ2857334.1 hypothetical protein J3B02_001078 [Coemansia erecta]
MQSNNNRESQPRQIPGFVWDAERGRYFPSSSRAPDRIERQNEKREQTRVSAIVAAQGKQQHNKAKQCIARHAILRRQATYSHSGFGSRLGTALWGEEHLQRSYRDRVLLGCMLSNKVVADDHDLEHHTTAIGSFSRNSAGRNMVAVGDQSGKVTIIDRNRETILIHYEQEASMERFRGEITSIQWASTDHLVWSSLGNGQTPGCMTIYSNLLREPIKRHEISGSVFDASCFQANADPGLGLIGNNEPHLYISAGITGGISVVNVTGTDSHEVFKARTGTDILSTAFIDGPNVIVGGGRDGRIRLFDCRISAKKHKPSRGLLATDDCQHSTSIHGVRSSQGWLLASASMDSQVRIWDVRMTHRRGTQQQKSVFSVNCLNNLAGQTEHMLAPCRLGFSARLDVVAAASSDNHVRMWSMTSGSLLQILPLAAGSGPCRALDLDYDPSAAEAALYICQQSLLTSFSHRFK